MTMFRRRSTVRSVAAHLLLLWVFALGAGVVHACGLTSKPNGAGQVAGVAAVVDVHRHHHAGHDHEQPADQAGKATCVKFCGDAKAVSMSPDLSGDVSETALHVLWPMLRFDVRQFVGAMLSDRVRWRDVRRPGSIAIAFVRLAL